MKLNLMILFLNTLWLITSCKDKVPLEQLDTDGYSTDSIQADQVLSGARIQLMNGNYVTARVTAGVIQQFEQNLLLADQGLTIYFLNRAGDTISFLKAEKGRIYPVSNNMEASEEVEVMGQDSMALFTDRLLWDNQREIIYTPDEVVIRRGDDYMKGRDFEATADLRRYELRHVYISTFQKMPELK